MSLSALSSLKEPAVLVRGALGLLLLANLIAAMFAFHVFGTSPAEIDASVVAARSRLAAEQVRLTRSRRLTGNIDKGRTESEAFLATYATSRRHTYSTIISEINQTSKLAGMSMKEQTISPLDPIEGSDDLDIMSMSINFEGGYAQLVKFVNLLDRSPRFLVIESMQAAPQPKGDVLTVTLKMNTLVKDDVGGAL
jgi:type IV pilus assembly protein PilO